MSCKKFMLDFPPIFDIMEAETACETCSTSPFLVFAALRAVFYVSLSNASFPAVTGVQVPRRNTVLIFCAEIPQADASCFLSEEEVATLTDNIGNYAKFVLQEMLKEKTAFDTPYKIPPIRSLADLA